MYFAVFPAYAGMIPGHGPEAGLPGRVPRVCGDDPDFEYGAILQKMCSPRMRG